MADSEWEILSKSSKFSKGSWDIIEPNAQPFYERGIDILATAKRETPTAAQLQAEAIDDFVQSLPVPAPAVQTSLLLNLEDKLRRHICFFLFSTPANDKKITLSPIFATKDVFADDYFVKPWDVLEDVEDVMYACRRLRDDVQTFFWTEYKFHVSISPFTAPMTSPVSQQWLKIYANRIQHLTLEVDLTRLGFNAGKNSALLGTQTKKIKRLFDELVGWIEMRQGTMADLQLMVRRFQGMRPKNHAAPVGRVDIKSVPYCPDEYISVCDQITTLRGIVRTCRLSGFTQDFAHQTMFSLFGGALAPTYLDPKDQAWPEWYLIQPGVNRPTSPVAEPITPSLGGLSLMSKGSAASSEIELARSTTPTYTPPGLGIALPQTPSQKFKKKLGDVLGV
ncbi:MAG: hypothetical protein M1818_007435 [Claussenomyces sp. TS43310]|nr:MAG: hypothetical protein M1818_007435 [Claussenomyces sp. TS43310]